VGLSSQLLRDLMPAADDVSILAARLVQRRRRKAREARGAKLAAYLPPPLGQLMGAAGLMGGLSTAAALRPGYWEHLNRTFGAATYDPDTRAELKERMFPHTPLQGPELVGAVASMPTVPSSAQPEPTVGMREGRETRGAGASGFPIPDVHTPELRGRTQPGPDLTPALPPDMEPWVRDWLSSMLQGKKASAVGAAGGTKMGVKTSQAEGVHGLASGLGRALAGPSYFRELGDLVNKAQYSLDPTTPEEMRGGAYGAAVRELTQRLQDARGPGFFSDLSKQLRPAAERWTDALQPGKTGSAKTGADPGYFSQLAERLRNAGAEAPGPLQGEELAAAMANMPAIPGSSGPGGGEMRAVPREGREGPPRGRWSDWFARNAGEAFRRGMGEPPAEYAGTRTPSLRGGYEGTPDPGWATHNWLAGKLSPQDVMGETMIKTESVKTGSERENLENAIAFGLALAERDLMPAKVAAASYAGRLDVLRRLGLLKKADPGYFSQMADQLPAAPPSDASRWTAGMQRGTTGAAAPSLGGALGLSGVPNTLGQNQDPDAVRPGLGAGLGAIGRLPGVGIGGLDSLQQNQGPGYFSQLSGRLSQGGEQATPEMTKTESLRAQKLGSLYQQMAQDLPPEKRELFFKIAEVANERSTRALLRLRELGLIGPEASR